MKLQLFLIVNLLWHSSSNFNNNLNPNNNLVKTVKTKFTKLPIKPTCTGIGLLIVGLKLILYYKNTVNDYANRGPIDSEEFFENTINLFELIGVEKLTQILQDIDKKPFTSQRFPVKSKRILLTNVLLEYITTLTEAKALIFDTSDLTSESIENKKVRVPKQLVSLFTDSLTNPNLIAYLNLTFTEKSERSTEDLDLTFTEKSERSTEEIDIAFRRFCVMVYIDEYVLPGTLSKSTPNYDQHRRLIEVLLGVLEIFRSKGVNGGSRMFNILIDLKFLNLFELLQLIEQTIRTCQISLGDSDIYLATDTPSHNSLTQLVLVRHGRRYPLDFFYYSDYYYNTYVESKDKYYKPKSILLLYDSTLKISENS